MELVAAARSGRTNDVRRLLDEGSRVTTRGRQRAAALFARAGGHWPAAPSSLLRGASTASATETPLVAVLELASRWSELPIESPCRSPRRQRGPECIKHGARGGHADIVASPSRGPAGRRDGLRARDREDPRPRTSSSCSTPRARRPPAAAAQPVVDITVDRVEVSSPPSGVAGRRRG